MDGFGGKWFTGNRFGTVSQWARLMRVWDRASPKGDKLVGQVVAANRAAPSDHARAVMLPSSASSVPRARQLVADDLADAHLLPTIIENALVVVTELVTNAILHAQPLRFDDTRVGIVLRWAALSDEVLIDVSDGGGSVRPHLRAPSTSKDDGRGLSIVNALAREWDIRTEPGQVTVHAVVGPWNTRR